VTVPETGVVPSPEPVEPQGGDAPKRRISPLAGLVFLAGLVLTGTLAWVSFTIHDHNEDRLLHLQLRQAGSVVAEAIPSIQLPLTSAAALAEATNGDPGQFQSYVTPFVGGSGPFVSASLWRVAGTTATQVALVGTSPSLSQTPGRLQTFLSDSRREPGTLAVMSLLDRSPASIAYAAPTAVPTDPWVVLAERALPANRKLNVTKNSAFSQLNYAIYLGTKTTAENLLGTSVARLPLSGRTATVSVPFGSSAITLVATPNEELGGTLLARLPWIVGAAGIILSLLAGVVADYLVRRRRQAEWLASENRRMYSEQRSIAAVLQHALLPQVLPEVDGVETAIRYVAGGEGADVGGDWYDIIPIDDNHFVFVLGDVSGRGVEAATIMARLHFAIRAYAIAGDSPVGILTKLGRLLSIEGDRCFATILCGLADVSGHTITLVNAGHPPLLLLNGRTAEFIRTTIFPPIGVQEASDYVAEHVTVPPGGTIVAFTDGLVERRGETIDTGLERLRALSTENHLPLDDLLTKILTESAVAGYHDDTAILAVRWKT
jgi:hypothetical protein